MEIEDAEQGLDRARALADALPEGGEVIASGSPWVLVARTFAQNKLAVLGLGLLVAVTIFSFAGPVVYRTNQTDPNLLMTNQAPSGGALLGTDSEGFDVLGRLMAGGQRWSPSLSRSPTRS